MLYTLGNYKSSVYAVISQRVVVTFTWFVRCPSLTPAMAELFLLYYIWAIWSNVRQHTLHVDGGKGERHQLIEYVQLQVDFSFIFIVFG